MRNRRIALLLLAVLLIASLSITVFAAENDSAAQLKYVTDSAGILTADQAASLERAAADISARHGFSVYVITLQDYRDYTSSTSIANCCMEMYDGYKLGWGSERMGTAMMLSMAERDYHLHFNSSKADEVFTDRGRDMMLDRILPYFSNNDYYGGFREYLDCCDEYLTSAENGKIIGGKTGMGIFSAIPGAIAALIASASLSAPMKSAKLKTNANTYIVPGSMNLTHRHDRFLHRTVTRQRRQQSSGSSHSSGTSFRSGSHSGRSGKF